MEDSMGNLSEYVALRSKICKMSSKLLTKSDYDNISECESIDEVVEWLKKKNEYQDFFDDKDIIEYHRENVENALICSLYRDYKKIYRFSNIRIREYLKPYLVKHINKLIKKSIRKTKDDYMTPNIFLYEKEFFSHYAKLDYEDLLDARNLNELNKALKNKGYEDIFKKSNSSFGEELEKILDHYYYINFWKKRKTLFKKSDSNDITKLIGKEADFLNIMWIYRAHKYYRMNFADILALTIPVYYKLTKEDIRALINSQDRDDFINILKKTFYGEQFENDDRFEELSNELLEKLVLNFYRKDPYSVFSMYNYFYEKEREINNLITITECIRYKYSPEKIRKKINYGRR